MGQIGSNLRFNIMNAFGTGSVSSEPNIIKRTSTSHNTNPNSDNLNANIFPSSNEISSTQFDTIHEEDEDNQESVSKDRLNVNQLGACNPNVNQDSKEGNQVEVDKGDNR